MSLEFKLHQLYRTRDGRKAQIFMLDNGDGNMLGCVEMSDGIWETQSWPKSGSFAASLCVNLVSEWREPIERKCITWVALKQPLPDGVWIHSALGIETNDNIKSPRCPIKVEITMRELSDDAP